MASGINQLKQIDLYLLLLRVLTRLTQAEQSSDDLQARLESLTEELEQTNSGILLLHKELDDKNVELSKRNQELTATLAELEENRAALQEASKHKSEFLANVSHEIRTPMNAIIGMTEMLLRTTTDNQTQEMLEVIADAGQNLLSLINDILDLSKIEAGKLVLEYTDFSPASLIEECAQLFKKQASSKGLFLHTSFDEKIPGTLVGDSSRLRQILVNLIGNALKFTQIGGVLVRVRLDSEESDQPSPAVQIKFSVTDTGIGLSPEKAKELFQPFAQADASTTRKYGGTGLGLSICKRLVESMGGEIGVDSTPDRGSTFWFSVRFEVSNTPVKPSIPEHPRSQPPTRQILSRALAGRGLILLVEDHPANQMIANLQLKELGLDHDVASNGLEAVQAVSRKKYDVILMDCHMPEMDGFEATQAIRASEHNGKPRIPIIAMTASAMQDERESCFAAGMDDYISKPVELKELYRTLDKWLPGGSANGQETAEKETVIAASGGQADHWHAARVFVKNKFGDLVDEGTTRKMLNMFVDDALESMPSFQDAIESRSGKALLDCAHRLKGAAGAIGFERAAEALEQLETIARSEDWEAARSEYQTLRAHVEHLKEAAQSD